jgi:hypothetical protein
MEDGGWSSIFHPPSFGLFRYPPPMAFLTARWSNLCLFTWPVPAELLMRYLPRGLELDLHDGQPHVSLVAFDFLDTRVLDIPWPGYTEFPEINLRFYVRHGEDRGVIFIREFVPLRLVVFIAGAIYNEPYRVMPMQSRVAESADQITIRHELTFAGRTNRLSVTGKKPFTYPSQDSIEHHFKEHQWGFGATRGGVCTRYQVLHPLWLTCRVTEWELDWDWAGLYGPEWSILQDVGPSSIILSPGSAVSVMPRGHPA